MQVSSEPMGWWEQARIDMDGALEKSEEMEERVGEEEQG